MGTQNLCHQCIGRCQKQTLNALCIYRSSLSFGYCILSHVISRTNIFRKLKVAICKISRTNILRILTRCDMQDKPGVHTSWSLINLITDFKAFGHIHLFTPKRILKYKKEEYDGTSWHLYFYFSLFICTKSHNVTVTSFHRT